MLTTSLTVSFLLALTLGEGPPQQSASGWPAGREEATSGSVATAPVPAARGYRIYFDPATGQIIDDPTPAQVRALDQAVARDRGSSGPELRRVPRTWSVPAIGGTGIELDERFFVGFRSVIGVGGANTTTCSPLDHQAHPPPPVPEPVRFERPELPSAVQ